MRIKYFPDTDTLIIDIKEEPIAESEYLEDLGVIIDYNEKNEIVGFEILNWSKFQKEGKELKLPVYI
ncbi:DUF2283 domain-containing protein [Aquifex aeolicus]|uniref:DUF2283 domain-containing protein n=1 Tax=Aquifex aeolicus TaxID=63363 RepID=UPI0002D8D46F|nr:DUF2283 domain-containing protein [Aquifex aeolicus]